MNYNELQVVIGGYLMVSINDPKVTTDEISTFVVDVINKNNLANNDVINVLNMMIGRAQSDDRMSDILNSLGLKLPSIKKDLFQVYFQYYLIKANFVSLKSALAAYKAQYGEDEHTVVTEIRLLFDSSNGNVPVEQLAPLVEKAKSYL